MKILKMFTRFTLPSVLLIVLCTEAPAIEFTETNDFSGNLGSPAQITPALETGINKIHGSVPADFGISDTDVFEVQLPVGLTISSISIEVSNYVPAGGDEGRFEILFSADGNTGSVNIPSDGTFELPFSLGDPSRIVFRISGPEDFMTFTAGSFDYTVNIAVMHQPFAMGVAYQGNSELQLSWPSVSGRLYRLQSSSSLEPSSWRILKELCGDGATITVSQSVGTQTRNFYRVVSP